MAKAGRPKTTVKERLDNITFDMVKVEQLAYEGYTDAQLASLLDVNEKTIRRWKEDEQFLSALKRGKEKADQRVVDSLFKRALGFEYEEVCIEDVTIGQTKMPGEKKKTTKKIYVGDVTAQIFWLKNRQPNDWRDKKEHSVDEDSLKTLAGLFIRAEG